ncbi:DUF1707 SHOCT-like domain-containing protein [Amycolatopsis azurea]|uniref:DUF1707 domain-containing protein n=1 Tax=Amycolatopsis azurea DSM 43854 TaxID=1238180 RepID=M2PRF2_9PSEU|nr:DUF1707 domain-containing protein [Amycolatopsis azurea]EMD22115.1 hypothetical protein C791_0438 [Amycolatopsis azurea DSM 43854]OOC06332.1 hypothetical protein B0293_12605 [Amycolatopsis azurea DSM 43854]
MRLSDAERQDALEALEEHVRTGRLDLDEFGSRSAKVSAARMASELEPLFTDLPSPRPSALLPLPPMPGVAQASAKNDDRPPSKWLAASAVPIAAAVAIAVFFFTRGTFLVFLLPLAVALIMSRRR